MRKTFLKVSLLAVLGLGMSASFTSCKDYDSEIDNLQSQIDQLKQTVDQINSLVKGGAVITGVSQNGQGVTVTLSDGKTFTITNGKDGANGAPGAPGKDADVWTIEKNDKGELMWALNGQLTQYPAQGPAGQNGTTQPGIYYVPNEDGFFYKVDPAKGGEPEKTNISWKTKGGLSAVATNDKVTVSGIVNEKGEPAEDIVLWRSMFVKSLVVVPELYLDGIEATRYGVAGAGNILATTKAPAAGTTVNNVPYSTETAATTTATVAAGQPIAYGDKEKAGAWVATEKASLSYHLNPSNAVVEGMNYDLLFDNVEVVNRSSAVKGTVLSQSVKDGDLTITYQLDKKTVAGLAPYSNTNNAGKEVGVVSAWTMMALQVENPQNDSNLVTSDNVAIVKETITLKHLMVSQAAPVTMTNWTETSNTAATALQQVANNPLTIAGATKSSKLEAPYNATFPLAQHIAIAATSFTNMIEGDGVKTDANGQNAQNDTKAELETELITLAQAKARFGLTANYKLVTYTVAPNSTSEDRFASINEETGVITPMYVNNAGQSVATSATEGRSAIGRQPMVYVTLNDAEGNLVLAGFVTVKWTEKTAPSTATVLSDRNIPYICKYKVESTWEEITGKIYEDLNLTPDEFFKNFALSGADADGNSSEVYQLIGGNYVNTTKNSAVAKGSANYGSWNWDVFADGAHTQKLTFTIDKGNYETWYPTFKANGDWDKNVVTTSPVTKTLYAKFVSTGAINQVVYIGFNITVIGAPAADYGTKLISQWTSDLAVAPINPAVPGQTKASTGSETTPVQVATGLPYASAISMDFQSVWEGGVPTIKNANALYNFTNNKAPYLLGNIKASYVFNAKQNPASVKGLEVGGTAKEYALSVSKTGKTLIATNNKVAQPIATIGNDANGLQDVITMLPYYTAQDANGDVTLPISGTTTLAAYACDIVNAQAYDKDAPAITFDVLMNVTYQQLTDENKVALTAPCTLQIPDSYEMQVGIGRPISLTDEGDGELQDAVNGAVLASKLFKMKDWQGHALWNVGRTGTVTTNTFNGATLDQFWFSQGSYAGTIATVAPNYSAYGLTIDLGNALVGNDPDRSKNLGKFNEVYVDKKLTLNGPAANIDAAKNTATVADATLLDDINISWTNTGSSVTSNIYVFVPVKVTYVWGQNILLGYATITIKPTLSE